MSIEQLDVLQKEPRSAGRVADWEGLAVGEHAFPLGSRERKLILLLFDLFAVNAGIGVAVFFREQELSTVGLGRVFLWFLVPSVLWIALAHAFDLYNVYRWLPLRSLLRSVVKVSAISYAGFLLTPFVMPTLPDRRFWLLLPFFAVVALSIGFRLFYGKAVDRPRFARRVVVYGAGWAGETIARLLATSGNNAFQLLGFLDDDPLKIGRTLEGIRRDKHVQEFRAEVLGDRYLLESILEAGLVDTIVLAITHDVDGELLQILMDGLEKGVEIVPMPVLYEQLTGRVPIDHVGENWYVAMPVQPSPSTAWLMLKRALDILMASMGMLFLLPVLPIISAAIFLDSPGPIFYSQLRVGKGGRLFRIYKFRSMVPNAENGKAVWAKNNDSRVTRVGRILRKTHLDEFPQFWNILKGDMSAVGPRPERPEFVEELAEEIPFYRVRHAVKPGMAGWALVKHGYASSKRDAVAKLQYDLYYVKHQSFWLDMEILLRTFVDAISFHGRA